MLTIKDIMYKRKNNNDNSIALPLMEGNELPVRKWKDKYEVAVPVGRYADGRIKYKRELADTEIQAFSREEELLEELKRLNASLSNQKPEVPKILFKEIATKWLRQKKLEVAPKTWTRYDSIVKLHILPVFGDRYISDIDEEEIRDYFLENSNCGTTLQQHHTILKNIFELAEVYVMKKIKRPRKNNTEINCIKDPFQLAAFVSSFKDSVLFPTVYIAAVTGMRLSEIAGLRWNDVDFNTGSITVSRSLHWRHETGVREWYIKATKNGSSKRTIKISKKDVNVLKDIKDERNASGKDFVCLDANGQPISSDSVSSNFKARAKARGFEITFHSLRHSHATILIQHYRKSINAVSKRLGHANELTTITIYTSILPHDDEDIADTMGLVMENI